MFRTEGHRWQEVEWDIELFPLFLCDLPEFPGAETIKVALPEVREGLEQYHYAITDNEELVHWFSFHLTPEEVSWMKAHDQFKINVSSLH